MNGIEIKSPNFAGSLVYYFGILWAAAIIIVALVFFVKTFSLLKQRFEEGYRMFALGVWVLNFAVIYSGVRLFLSAFGDFKKISIVLVALVIFGGAVSTLIKKENKKDQDKNEKK